MNTVEPENPATGTAAPPNEHTASASAILSARRISKSFGDIQVLFGIDFDIRPGEVHALIGENGAGKSTLMKILSGFLQPTAGQLLMDGSAISLPPDGQAEDLGIVLLHQEFNLAEHLSVEENIFLGREIIRRGFLDKRSMRAQTSALLARLNVSIDPDTIVSELSVSQKQFVEIARALARNARILIMDEPTAVLTPDETAAFFDQIRKMRTEGVGIVLISHKLDEVKELSDRVTVLRDGHLITSASAGDLSEDDMARHMVGRDLSDMFPPKAEPDVDAPLVMSAHGLSLPGVFSDISFELRQGEILGFAGLIGSGRSALFEAIIGLSRNWAGDLQVHGQPARYGSLSASRAAGIAYLTKDRKDKGLLLNANLKVNLTLFALNRYQKRGLLDNALEEEALNRAIRRFDIRVKDRSVPVNALSGGNQQNSCLGKSSRPSRIF